jgi:hypothetical protein
MEEKRNSSGYSRKKQVQQEEECVYKWIKYTEEEMVDGLYSEVVRRIKNSHTDLFDAESYVETIIGGMIQKAKVNCNVHVISYGDGRIGKSTYRLKPEMILSIPDSTHTR